MPPGKERGPLGLTPRGLVQELFWSKAVQEQALLPRNGLLLSLQGCV